MANIIERITIEPREDAFRMYAWGTYGESSVLSGQPLRMHLGDCVSVQECRAQIERDPRYRTLPVEVLDHSTFRPYVNVGHLPGPDDPVPGGMYPDDIGEWPPEP